MRTLALVGNMGLLVFLMIWSVEVRLSAVGVLLCATPVFSLLVLNIWLIWQGPDGEERKLRREVAKAELRRRLRMAEKE